MGLYRTIPDGKAAPTFTKNGFYRSGIFQPGESDSWLNYFIVQNTFGNFYVNRGGEMRGTIISYNGAETRLYENRNLNTRATGQIYLNENCWRTFNNCQFFNFNFLQELNTSLVTNGAQMFWMCYNLNEQLSFPNLVNGYYMFASCRNLNQQLSFPNLVDGYYMFESCSSLYNMPLINWQHIDNCGGMFKGCGELRNTLNEPIIIHESIKGCQSMFDNTPQLSNINVYIHTPNNAGYMFGGFDNSRLLNVFITNPLNRNNYFSFINCNNGNQGSSSRTSEINIYARNLYNVVNGYGDKRGFWANNFAGRGSNFYFFYNSIGDFYYNNTKYQKIYLYNNYIFSGVYE